MIEWKIGLRRFFNHCSKSKTKRAKGPNLGLNRTSVLKHVNRLFSRQYFRVLFCARLFFRGTYFRGNIFCDAIFSRGLLDSKELLYFSPKWLIGLKKAPKEWLMPKWLKMAPFTLKGSLG